MTRVGNTSYIENPPKSVEGRVWWATVSRENQHVTHDIIHERSVGHAALCVEFAADMGAMDL